MVSPGGAESDDQLAPVLAASILLVELLNGMPDPCLGRGSSWVARFQLEDYLRSLTFVGLSLARSDSPTVPGCLSALAFPLGTGFLASSSFDPIVAWQFQK